MNTSKAILERTTFITSREMDFFSEKELVTQTGHSMDEWPLVILKESLDNALDACEEHDVPPEIQVTADAEGITVRDNGSGIPESTIRGVLDFTVRASNREAYVAPDRGAQGNALMTLVAMPYVLSPEDGRFVISSHGVQHGITCKADPITQKPVVHDDQSSSDHGGTTLSIQWEARRDDDGDVAWPFDDYCDPVEDGRWSVRNEAFRLLRGYAFFNPHVTLAVKWFDETMRFEATEPAWRKWRPNQPTSPHWYEVEHLTRLIAAYVALDREQGTDRTVAKFLGEFDGLTGTGKQKLVLADVGMARTKLSELVGDDGHLSSDRIAALLAAMQTHTRVVKARRLGLIGKDHLLARFQELGCDPKQFEYKKIAREDDGIPFVLESAFGWLGEGAEDHRHIFTGANWSAAIKNPFRSFGATGRGLESQLAEFRAGSDEPIIFVLHLAHPRVEYTDRGKSALVVGD